MASFCHGSMPGLPSALSRSPDEAFFKPEANESISPADGMPLAPLLPVKVTFKPMVCPLEVEGIFTAKMGGRIFY
jgi:hypothetical protein